MDENTHPTPTEVPSGPDVFQQLDNIIDNYTTFFEDDAGCIAALNSLLEELELEEDEKTLLAKCLTLAEANTDADVDFGAREIIAMKKLEKKHKSHADMIRSCYTHLGDSIDLGPPPKSVISQMAELTAMLNPKIMRGRYGENGEIILLDSESGESIDSSEFFDSGEEDDSSISLSDLLIPGFNAPEMGDIYSSFSNEPTQSGEDRIVETAGQQSEESNPEGV